MFLLVHWKYMRRRLSTLWGHVGSMRRFTHEDFIGRHVLLRWDLIVVIRHGSMEHWVFRWNMMEWWRWGHRHINRGDVGMVVSVVVRARVSVHRRWMRAPLLRVAMGVPMSNAGAGSRNRHRMGGRKGGQMRTHERNSWWGTRVKLRFRRGMWRCPFAHWARRLLGKWTHWRSRCCAHIRERSVALHRRRHCVGMCCERFTGSRAWCRYLSWVMV